MTLSTLSWSLMAALTAWFALNFIGVPDLVSAEPLMSLAGLNLALMCLWLAMGVARMRFAALLAALTLAVWAYLQFETHWRGFLWGRDEATLGWYERVWGANWSFLPDAPGYTVPDGYHALLFAGIVLALASCLRDVMRGFRA